MGYRSGKGNLQSQGFGLGAIYNFSKCYQCAGRGNNLTQRAKKFGLLQTKKNRTSLRYGS